MTECNVLRPFALTLSALLAATSWCDAQEVLRRGSSNEQLIDDQLRQSVKRGLDWLQAHQRRDGHWAELVGYKLNTDYETLDPDSLPHVGVTSLALMSFLAGGHLPDRGEYGAAVRNGLDFVLSCAKDDGQIMQNGTRLLPRRVSRHGHHISPALPSQGPDYLHEIR